MLFLSPIRPTIPGEPLAQQNHLQVLSAGPAKGGVADLAQELARATGPGCATDSASAPVRGAAIGPGRGPYTGPAQRGGSLYGAEKAALERFTQGLAQEVYQDGVSVTCVTPSQVVPHPCTVFHHLVNGMDDPRGQSPALVSSAALVPHPHARRQVPAE